MKHVSTHLSDIVEPDAAGDVAAGDVVAAGTPGHLVERRVALHECRGRGHLRIIVQVPQVEPARAVHCCEQRRVVGRPRHV